MLIEPLDLTTPVSAFNGGLVVNPDMSVIEQKEIDASLVPPILDLMRSFELDSWIYRGAEWYIQDPKGPHVDQESKTVHFAPTVVDSYDQLTTEWPRSSG